MSIMRLNDKLAADPLVSEMNSGVEHVIARDDAKRPRVIFPPNTHIIVLHNPYSYPYPYTVTVVAALMGACNGATSVIFNVPFVGRRQACLYI